MKWVRTVSSAILGVIAVVGLLCSVVGFWARDTVFDESEVAAAAESALDEPGVTDALAARLTTSVMSAIDLETRINAVLPPRLQTLTPAIVGGTEQLVQNRLTDRLADPDTRQLMVGVFTRAYAGFLDVIEGEGLVDGVTVEHGAVTVNFLPVVGEGLALLQRVGLLDDVEVPDLTRQGDPSADIAALEQALGRDLPDDFAQVTVYESDRLERAGETVDRAQQLLVLIKRAFFLILAVTVVALIASVVLAHRRRRAALILLLASAGVFVVARALVNQILDELPTMARQPAGQAALAAASSVLADGLVKALGVGAVLFLLGALVVYLSDSESAVRRRMAAGTGTASVGDAVAGNRTLVAVAAFVAAVLVLSLAGFSWLSVVIALVLAVVGVLALVQPPGGAAPTVPAAPSVSDED